MADDAPAKKGYWIAHVRVDDPEGWAAYVEAARPAFEAYGARFLARGGAYSEVESALGRTRHVVSEFPSYQAALDCYRSETYQAAKKLRENAGVAYITLVEGA
jgi:uncharacterized protein (DUF1330 family)